MNPASPPLEYLFEVQLRFTRVQHIATTPAGAGRSAVYVDAGVVRGPRLNGRVVPDSGGDWAQLRPDGTLALDARYMIEADDGALILLRNRGFLWGRTSDVMPRIRAWIFDGGAPVPTHEYYLRTTPEFEVAVGPHDWLTRHVIVGVGERRVDGNVIRYFALN